MRPHPPGPGTREHRLAWLWALLFPSRCLGCSRRDTLLCDQCRPAIPWLPPGVCPRCAAPSRLGKLCRRCTSAATWHLGSVRAACSYDGVARTAIHQLKYRHDRSTAPLLAEFIATSLATRPIQADLVIPVPLSARRLRERGYNQSALIARHLSALTNLPTPANDLLVRTRDTKPQVGLSARERLTNMRGAFACTDPSTVTGRRLLLVDDVMTTGSTLEACAEPLRVAGAERVIGLVVAREF